jgi:DNA-binding GntR family transcriptional regulator
VAVQLIRGLREQVADRLRDDIMAGRLPEGEKLSEGKLAAHFGVSRGPIREAMLQLRHEGLLEAKPNGRVQVMGAAPDELHQLILPLRATIETYALRFCFADLGAEDFRTWQAIVDKMERAARDGDLATFAEQDIAFHRTLLIRAGQPDLVAIWSTIAARLRSHFHKDLEKNLRTLLEVHADHQALLELFRGGNQDRALERLERHILGKLGVKSNAEADIQSGLSEVVN